MPLRTVIETVRRHLGMYVEAETFDCGVSFLSGSGTAQSGGFLVGFREWLVVRADRANNLAWPGVLLTVVGGLEARGDSAKTINGLFDLLEEFFAARQAGDG